MSTLHLVIKHGHNTGEITLDSLTSLEYERLLLSYSIHIPPVPLSHYRCPYDNESIPSFRFVVQPAHNQLCKELIYCISNTESWACVCTLQCPDCKLQVFKQLAVMEFGGGKKKKKMQSHNTKASVPAFLHTDNTTAPDSIKDRTWLRSLTMFLWAVSVNRSGCVIFAKMPIDLFIIIKDTGNIVKTTCTKIPIQIYKD